MSDDLREDIRDNLRLLEELLLEQEKGGTTSSSLIPVLFRYAHNVKGAFGILGDIDCQRCMHELEARLDEVRHGRRPLSQEIVDGGLRVVSLLLEWLAGDEVGPLLSTLTDQLRTLAPDASVDSDYTPTLQVPENSPYLPHIRALTSGCAAFFKIDKLVTLPLTRDQAAALPIFEDLASCRAEVVRCTPDLHELSSGIGSASIEILFATHTTKENLSTVLFDPFIEVKLQLPLESTRCGFAAGLPRERALPRVLVVDDEIVSRRVLSRMLHDLASLDLAVDGREALIMCLLAYEEGRPYDLIFLDLKMPEWDGRSLLRILRHISVENPLEPRPMPKVVMTTGSREVSDVNACVEGGCDGYLAKPLERRDVERMLKRVVAISGAQGFDGS